MNTVFERDAAGAQDEVLVNSRRYPKGSRVAVPITDVGSDRFAAIRAGEAVTYRPLTEEEIAAGAVEIPAYADLSVKFCRYALFIDDRCVIAGDTGFNRILLSDYLRADEVELYCFGYDTSSGTPGTDGVGCICASNDLWKVVRTRRVYTGYCQVAVTIAPGKTVTLQNAERAFRAKPIPAGAPFPVCDANGPEHLEAGSHLVTSGTYYVKRNSIFSDGTVTCVVEKNDTLNFA